MQVAFLFATTLLGLVSASIIQNGQLRENPYPGQTAAIVLDKSWRTYSPDAVEIGYKGRWDSKHVSCMARVVCFFSGMGADMCLGWSCVL